MKGQLEVSFQWIYVVLAGGAFLLMFFFVFKSCSEAGDERAQGMSVRAAANAISLASWQEGTGNFTFAADASCVQGVLTLQAGTARSQLDQVPAFLPPHIGKAGLVTREVALTQPGVPSIRLGNVLYVLDERTRYYVQRSHETRLRQVIGHSPSVIYVDDLDSIEVPAGVDTVVLVGDDLPAVNLPDTDAEVYGVTIGGSKATFYTASGGKLGSPRDETYVGDHLMAGAVVAARPQTYRCAKDNFAGRTGAVLRIYIGRNDRLATEFRSSDSPRHVCEMPLAQASNMMGGVIATGKVNLEDLFGIAPTIMAQQRTLQGLGCPVIA